MQAEIKALLEKKKWKGKDLMIVLIIIGALFAILAIPTGKKEDTEEIESVLQSENGTFNPKDYEEELEMRLEEILSQMEGVGYVEVMITLEASTKEVIEKDLSTNQSVNQTTEMQTDSTVSKEETTVFSDTNAGTVPYVVQEIYPEVEGVLVVAQGGDDSSVKLAITDAIQALFGVDVHKIKIVKMNTD